MKFLASLLLALFVTAASAQQGNISRGAAVPTTQLLTSGTDATYTTPTTGVSWIEVYMVGGGAGGQGGGTATLGAGTPGNPTCWKASGTACSTPLYQAGGGGANSGGTGGAGGTVSGANTCNNSAIGSPGVAQDVAATISNGSPGGNSYFGGGGANAFGNAVGQAGATNSGSGGQGGGNGGVGGDGGAGGGAGAMCYFIINNPAGSYVYTIGAAASGGSAGTSGSTGGAGAAGKILVIEHYGN